MKTYIGQRGRLFVEKYGRRSPLPGDDVAARILSDVLGARVVEDDYLCYQAFRDAIVGPKLDLQSWTLSESAVRDWHETYREQALRARSARARAQAAPISDDSQQGAGPEEQEALVSWGNAISRARLLLQTSSVVLLEGEQHFGPNARPGAPLRVRLPGAPRMVNCRLAAIGQNNRFLVALGSRAVRGAARVRVDVAGLVNGATPGAAGQPVRIVDLSSSGARITGLDLGVGADFDLSFVPPGRTDLVSLRCVVVRAIPGDEGQQDLGIAFCGSALSFRVDVVKV